jgi:hypothetical protein
VTDASLPATTGLSYLLVKAIRVCFPASIRIPCWFHRPANIRAGCPTRPPRRPWRTSTRSATPRPGRPTGGRRPAHQRVRCPFPAAVACFEDDLEALLAAGESVAAVAESLSHENATLLLKTYGH